MATTKRRKKMRKIRIFYTLVLAMLFMATSCFDEKENLTKTWVAFDLAKVEILESAGDPVEVSVSYSGALRSDDIVIEYSLSSPDGALEGSDYTLPATSGEVVIPAGEASVKFVALQSLIDNDVSDGARSVVLTIESADGLTIGFPGPDGLKKSTTILIKDDDCAFDLNTLAGEYDVEIISEASFGNPAGSWLSTATISVGTEPNTLKDNNFWDFGNPGVITIDPVTLEVTIEGVQFVYNNASGLPRYAIQGTQAAGTIVNNCGIFTVNMELTIQDQTTVANRSVIIYTKK